MHRVRTMVIGIALTLISSASARSYSYMTKDLTLLKGQPMNVSLECPLAFDTRKCTWDLGPHATTLSNEDSLEFMDERYQVRIDHFINTCYLDIVDVSFGDAGSYDCGWDDHLPHIIWSLSIQGNPGPPVISHANGTQIEEDTVVVDETPVTFDLTCASTGARPHHTDIRWLIDGQDPADARQELIGPEDGSWRAYTNTSISFGKDAKEENAVRTVTCIIEHRTGNSNSTKVFGIRNTDKTVRLVHDNSTFTQRGHLRCETKMFPWPVMYQIIKLSDPPNPNDDTIYRTQEMDVEEDGRYICRTVVVTRTSPSTTYRWVGSNVVGIGVDPECPPGSALKTHLNIYLMTVNLILFFWTVNEL